MKKTSLLLGMASGIGVSMLGYSIYSMKKGKTSKKKNTKTK